MNVLAIILLSITAAFWAGACWIILAMIRMRKRRRNKDCWRCGYPQGCGHTCSECGANPHGVTGRFYVSRFVYAMAMTTAGYLCFVFGAFAVGWYRACPDSVLYLGILFRPTSSAASEILSRLQGDDRDSWQVQSVLFYSVTHLMKSQHDATGQIIGIQLSSAVLFHKDISYLYVDLARTAPDNVRIYAIAAIGHREGHVNQKELDVIEATLDDSAYVVQLTSAIAAARLGRAAESLYPVVLEHVKNSSTEEMIMCHLLTFLAAIPERAEETTLAICPLWCDSRQSILSKLEDLWRAFERANVFTSEFFEHTAVAKTNCKCAKFTELLSKSQNARSIR